MPPKSAQFLRHKSGRVAKLGHIATATRSRGTRSRPQSRPLAQHTGLSVVIPIKKGLSKEIKKKKKNDSEKRAYEDVSVEIAAGAPSRAVDIASQALNLEESGEWNDLDNEFQDEQNDELLHEEQPVPNDVLPPDLSLPREIRATQARAAYESGQYLSHKAAAAAWGISQASLNHLMKGPRLLRREAPHHSQKLDARDEDSVGKEALRRVEESDRRPTNVLLWEVANDLYREKCVHLGMEFQPIGTQWPQRFLVRNPDFRKTWSQLAIARKAPPRGPRSALPSGPHPWGFAEHASSIVDDDFSKFDIPKTKDECAAYFGQIRSGPPATAVRIQRFLTHLLVEQAKSVDMLSRVRKALEERGEVDEAAPQVATQEPQRKSQQAQTTAAISVAQSQQPRTTTASAPIVGIGRENPAAVLSRPSSQLPTNNIPQRPELHVSLTTTGPPSVCSEEQTPMAHQGSSMSLPPTDLVAQPQPSPEVLNTATSTPILSKSSANHTSTPYRPCITTFQQFYENNTSQPSQPPDQTEAHESQQRQVPADSMPGIGNHPDNANTLVRPYSAQDSSLPLQSPQTEQPQRDEAPADSIPTFSNAPLVHPPETLQSTMPSFQPSTTSMPQLLHYPEPQQSPKPEKSQDIDHSFSSPSSPPSSHLPASLESLMSSFQTHPTTNVRKLPPSQEIQGSPKPPQPPKPRKPSQPRKPQQPPNHMASSMAPFTGWGNGTLSVTSSSPYHSDRIATGYGSIQPSTQPQYYPNEYFLHTAVDQSSKRRRIDDPIYSINHPGFQ